MTKARPTELPGMHWAKVARKDPREYTLILKDKGDMVFTATPQETVSAVASQLFARRVGAVVVVNDAGEVVGIVSERDIVRVVAEHGPACLESPVDSCMTRDVHFATPGETVTPSVTRARS